MRTHIPCKGRLRLNPLGGGVWRPLRTETRPLEAGMPFCIAADGNKHKHSIASSMPGICGSRGIQVNSSIMLKDIELTAASHLKETKLTAASYSRKPSEQHHHTERNRVNSIIILKKTELKAPSYYSKPPFASLCALRLYITLFRSSSQVDRRQIDTNARHSPPSRGTLGGDRRRL